MRPTYSLKALFGIILLSAILVPCIRHFYQLSNSEPDLSFLGDNPYSGYSHSKPEHGWWRQIDTNGSQIQILELHLHDGGFTVVYELFETYHDYWGSYELDNNTNEVVFRIENGNSVPSLFLGAGQLYLIDGNTMEMVTLIDKITGNEKRIFKRQHPLKEWEQMKNDIRQSMKIAG